MFKFANILSKKYFLLSKSYQLDLPEFENIETQEYIPDPDINQQNTYLPTIGEFFVMIQIYMFDLLESYVMQKIHDNQLINLGIQSSLNNKKVVSIFLRSEQQNMATDEQNQMSYEDLKCGHYFSKSIIYKYLIQSEQQLNLEIYQTILNYIKDDQKHIKFLINHLYNSIKEYKKQEEEFSNPNFENKKVNKYNTHNVYAQLFYKSRDNFKSFYQIQQFLDGLLKSSEILYFQQKFLMKNIYQLKIHTQKDANEAMEQTLYITNELEEFRKVSYKKCSRIIHAEAIGQLTQIIDNLKELKIVIE